LGLAGLAGVVLAGVVEVEVAGVVADDEGAEGTETLPPVSPAFVTANVAARINAPRAAMMAGRGSSIRGALGTVRVEHSYC
jgi:hypothetical protein